jgi:FtsP/CotA-like multicopper oxidase with cupredoxin domain
VTPGLRQRWRVVNAARSRYFQLAVAGHGFVRIGGDGGFLETPLDQERAVLIPGERADLLFTPQGVPDDQIDVRWVAYDRGFGSTFNRPDTNLWSMRVGDARPVENGPLPRHLRTIERLDPVGATTQIMRLTSRTVDKKLVMGINGVPGDQAVPLPVRLGETQVWKVSNEIEFAHPFHLHGYFFQVLRTETATGPVPPGPLEWKDTADVPAKGKMDLVVRFDDRPGMWMFHCHILDHADAGMMGMFDLR